MNTKQVVAVIGASGKMGSALGRNLSKGNYRILLCSSKTDVIQSLLNEITTNHSSADVEIVEDAVDVCWEADIIILAIPYVAEKQVAASIKSVVNQKVIISVSNPINDSQDALLTPPGTSAAEELQRQLPNAKVIKAFNTVTADMFQQRVVDGHRMDCLIAGRDPEALEVVSDLVKAAGFKPVIVGDLNASRTLESMQLLLIQLMSQSKNSVRFCSTDHLTS